ncbi:MAG TPA: hypothetical protein VFI45_00905 [Candidatus Acidoferrum sp.]|nr:hypothetical protein [Candidatus Acidoferrum sp.]
MRNRSLKLLLASLPLILFALFAGWQNQKAGKPPGWVFEGEDSILFLLGGAAAFVGVMTLAVAFVLAIFDFVVWRRSKRLTLP